jgi:hypothetical protein
MITRANRLISPRQANWDIDQDAFGIWKCAEQLTYCISNPVRELAFVL